MKYETIVCPFCGNGHAHITYEENRAYQMNCPDCHNAIFHQDVSWDAAVAFFKHMAITDDDRLTEICAAEKDGRCVVLPCKVGQKVKVRCDTWGNSWNFKTYECGEFLHGEIISIIQTKKQTLMKIQVEHNVSWKRERKRYPGY